MTDEWNNLVRRSTLLGLHIWCTMESAAPTIAARLTTIGDRAGLGDREVSFSISVPNKGGLLVAHVLKDVHTLQVHILDRGTASYNMLLLSVTANGNVITQDVGEAIPRGL